MDAAHYVKNQTVRLKCTVTVDDVPTDPTSPTAKVRPPSGGLITGTAQKDSIGLYHYDVVADETGTWYFRFEGGGDAAGAGEGAFIVDHSSVL